MVPSVATALPSPHALTTSSSANLFTTSAIARFSFATVACRLATMENSCADTPGMCRAASA